MDIRTVFINMEHGADYAIAQLGLTPEDGLETAVIISLFTDRRADADDVIPDGTNNRRGWWADAYADIRGDQIGSSLWLLAREKQLPSVLIRAREYAEEALDWLVKDGIAKAVNVTAEIVRMGVLGLVVQIQRADGPVVKYRFENFWKGA